MLPDPPDGFSEKPFPDPRRDPDTGATQAETDFPGGRWSAAPERSTSFFGTARQAR
jgi:hypothetical protein